MIHKDAWYSIGAIKLKNSYNEFFVPQLTVQWTVKTTKQKQMPKGILLKSYSENKKDSF